ncbi:MAG: biliverdin-producing heme oxygenase [Phycisphaeraceae bacterium]|nr:biliverdin-producing heme oxygenase [Phycisphaeraceae bacterium]
MTTTQMNIMDVLKARTAEQHRRAEQSPFMRGLVSGQVTREGYARWLGQMMHVHAALESEIVARRGAEPRLAVASDEQFGAQRLRDDLCALGVDPASVKPLAGASAIAERVRAAAAARPVSLLGFHYVLEGSKNGNTYIAKALRRTLGLAPGAGDSYLDPYGDQQRARWAAYREAMGGQDYSETDAAAVLEAACAMFDGITELNGELN